MAPQQNTFTVISNGAPRGGAPSKPPMTSKQAQKLYKKANKAPRMSKAEQRKWEKERQEEIRKELEKERAAVKARAARERKKAKDEEARENRRRAGQPLIDCRPSQDTIARFVRGNGTNKKRDPSGEPESESDDGNAAEPITKKPKRPALVAKTDSTASSSHSAALQERKPDITSMPPPPRPSQAKQLPTPSPSSTGSTSQRKPPHDGTMPPPPLPKALSAAQALRAPPIFKPLVITPIQHRPGVPAVAGPPLKPPPRSKPKPFMMPRVILPTLPAGRQQPAKQEGFRQKPADRKLADLKQTNQAQQPPTDLQTEQKPAQLDAAKQETPKDELIKLEIPTRQKCEEQKLADQRLSGQRVVDQRPPEKKSPTQTQSMQIQPGQSQSQKKLSQPQKQPVEESPVQQSHMPPPRHSRQMALLTSGRSAARGTAAQLPPPSTQAILQGSFDDFFPTASQLVLELEDDEFGDVSQRSAQKPPMGAVNDIRSVPLQHPPGQLKHERRDEVGQGPTHHQNKQHIESSRDIQPFKKPLSTPSGGRRAEMHIERAAPIQRHSLGQCCPKQDRFGHQHRPSQGTLPGHARVSPIRHTTQAFQQRRTPTNGSLKTLHGRAAQETRSNYSPASRPTAAAKPAPLDDFFPLICTQDLMMSSQEVLEIESPAKMDSQSSSGGPKSHPLPSVELDLAAIDWDDDLDDF
ncbi:hypothetical protein CPLU01_05628 [Colletotrichum plurivorum]|uniref:Uncharacterized protein n=1 Tax=Colletotrichum plurivorum TaxID=2175906 RepID=A0A8H6KKN8_9PEZI|nr:hypothetical protein CPLU01_05628 [Colletotrichum plurivorum]